MVNIFRPMYRYVPLDQPKIWYYTVEQYVSFDIIQFQLIEPV